MLFDGKIIALTVIAALVGSLTLSAYDSAEPYMDEIFHIPQAQHYCHGYYGYWDSKITTFPGIYIFSSGLHRLSTLSCSKQFLRGSNLLLAILSPFLYSSCRLKITGHHQNDGLLISLLLLLYPLNAFYYFLYYTDTGSTLAVVAVYLLSLSTRTTENDQHVSKTNAAARRPNIIFEQQTIFLMACIAVLVRQTNAVWLLFMAGTRMVDYLEHKKLIRDDENILTVSGLAGFIYHLVLNLPQLLLDTWSLLLPVIGFIVFVIKNGGIVVGDKDHHKPVLHWAMPVYLFSLLSLCFFPTFLIDTILWVRSSREVLISNSSSTISGSIIGSGSRSSSDSMGSGEERKKKSDAADNNLSSSLMSPFSPPSSSAPSVLAGRGAIKTVIIHCVVHGVGLLFVAFILCRGVLSHPFLLADNRHYTFYLWRRILSKPLYRLALSPFCYTGIIYAIHRLRRMHGPLWVLIYSIAVCITLVPAHLLEPRYFTPGIVIAVLNSPPILASATTCSAAPEKGYIYRYAAVYSTIALFLLVNIGTIYVFIHRPFTWPDGSVARFMY